MKKLFQMNTILEASDFVDKMLGFSVPFGFRYIIGWFMRERSRRPGVQSILTDATIESKLSSGGCDFHSNYVIISPKI